MQRSSGPCEWQTSWVERIRQAETFEELERLEQTFTEELSEKASPRRSTCSSLTCPPAQGYAKDDPRRIRYLYYVNKARALKEIRGESSQPCEIPLDQLYKYFKDMFERKEDSSCGAPRPEDLSLLPRIESDFEELCGKFTPKEVTERLRRVRNKKGSRKKISPQLLKQHDPGCRILAALFNRCRRFGRIPSDWKKSTTILIHKRGDRDDPSSWRPLSLCHPLYKMYARCLAQRINAWATKGSAISSQQGAFVSDSDGKQKHIFLLQSLLDTVWPWRVGCEHECAVAKLDFANAFGSLSHRHIFSTLSEFGMSEDFLAQLRELYSECTTAVLAADGETRDIALQKGLKQGCPLSPLIFNLAIEPFIRYIANGSEGFWLYKEKLDILAYADDLVLIAESKAALQRMLDRASAAANWMGLCFNTHKCTTLHIRNKCQLPSEFTLQKACLPFLCNGAPFTHLRVPIYFPDQTPQTLRNLKASFRKMMEEAEKIDQSPLHPNQKMNALRTYLPQISSFLKNVPVAKKDLKEANRILHKKMGKWLDASKMKTPDRWVHQSYEAGRILEMQDLADVAVISYAFQLLTCQDKTVASVAFNVLYSDVQKGQGEKNLSMGDLVAYLNGSVGYGNSNFTSLWSRARNATLRLRKFIRCNWSYNKKHEFVIQVTRQSGGEVVFPSKGRSLEATLKEAVRETMFACQN